MATVTKSAAPSAQSIAVTLVGGAATFTATVTKADEAPSFSDDTGDAQSWTQSVLITIIQVPVADGNPTPTYAVVGTLPAGLGFNATQRRIFGTPTGTGNGTITIRATNSEGSDDWTVAYTIAAAATAPARPAAPSLTVDGQDQITAVGVAPDDGGSPITSYNWRYRVNSSGNPWVNRSGETSLTQVFDGLDAATEYRVQFRAVNNVGTGPRSPAAFATTDAAPAEQPVAATLVGAAGSLAATVTKSTAPATQPVAVTLSGVVATFTTIVTKSAALSVQSVAVTFSGGSSILTAEVRIEMAGSWMEAIGVTSPYTIYNLTNGVEYEVQVRANNDAGGTWSDIAMGTPISGATLVVIQALEPTVTVTLVVPVPPGRVPLGAVRSGNNELTVTWEAPDEEGTNGIDYYDMRIRSAAPSSSPEEVEEWTVLDRVAPDDREHTIKGLANHFEFEVQVRGRLCQPDYRQPRARAQGALVRRGCRHP